MQARTKITKLQKNKMKIKSPSFKEPQKSSFSESTTVF